MLKNMRKQSLLLIASCLTIVTLVSLGAPVMASKVNWVSLKSDASSYPLSGTVGFTVRANWDTSGIFGIGCLKYKIIIKEVKWWGLWKTEITQATYEGSCYLGRLPNPVYIEQNLYVSANRLGRGSHSLYAEVWFASSIFLGTVTGWDKASSSTIQVVIR
jgi:hypothetical protein